MAAGCKRSNDQNVSLLNAVLRESKGALTSPGKVRAGAETSNVNPFELRN